jgi:hypothetical protein
MLGMNLKLQNNDFRLDAGTFVTLNCDNVARKCLTKCYPKATIQWLHNGLPITADPPRTVEMGTTLQIGNAQPYDSGVYICQIDTPINEPRVIGAFALAVKSNDNIYTTVGSSISINCNGASLGNLFGGLQQVWVQRGIPMEGGPTPLNEGKDYLDNVTTSLNGNWECLVFDAKYKRVWSTNRIAISVSP